MDKYRANGTVSCASLRPCLTDPLKLSSQAGEAFLTTDSVKLHKDLRLNKNYLLLHMDTSIYQRLSRLVRK